MVFIDDLGIELYSVAFVGFLMLYMTIRMFMAYRKGERNLENYVRSGIIPMTVLGLFILVMGLYGEMTWPLPGSYNILFYDPYVMLGVILLGSTLTILLKEKMQNIGFLTLMVGFVMVSYGFGGYSLGLTAAPIGLLGLFVSAGLTGIFAYPVTLLMDRSSSTKKRPSNLWMVALALFWIFLLMTSVLAAYVASAAIPAHLLSAP